jgi:hypothetical protein
MDEQNSPIFSQAKLEYTNQLIDTLTPHIFDGIKSIYDEAITVNSVNRTQSITLLFRDFLENVPSWSNVLIEAETERIIKMSKCDWLDDLITAVFISHTKILTSIGTNSSNIDLIIPKITNFIHKCYINIARETWKNPYLFTDYSIASEYQKNMRTVELIIKESIENTIRQLLPIKEILKHNLDTHDSRNINEKSILETNDIRKILHEEIKNLNLGNIINTQMIDVVDDGETIRDEEDDDDCDEEDGEGGSGNVNEEYENEGMKAELKNDDEVGENINENEIDDYVSVDEETIQKNCENLDVNTLNDENKEELYDNVDIVEKYEKDEKPEKSMLEKFIENLTHTNENETTNIHTENDKEKEIKLERVRVVEENIEDNLPSEESKETIKAEINDVEEEDSFNETAITKKKETELISVEKISDNETVDEFFNDVSRIIENKTGVSVNKQPEKYTLFDDIDNKE